MTSKNGFEHKWKHWSKIQYHCNLALSLFILVPNYKLLALKLALYKYLDLKVHSAKLFIWTKHGENKLWGI